MALSSLMICSSGSKSLKNVEFLPSVKFPCPKPPCLRHRFDTFKPLHSFFYKNKFHKNNEPQNR